ncbi:MAG TPA: hypothetical protein PLT82_05040 [Candidatus Hydrogenedens sp.]|nr:hypothetical protein [Candidatus Hydrogenedens sp.]HOK08790.1 hypothetical protein [Candidatus Hydrogenedens sp.]HOL20641.1 hypothetical protein [Candidatus Hydrogenedens sp.]HPP58479.1 hypothetical protein [Candidatus Hydrogenedens sp.]
MSNKYVQIRKETLFVGTLYLIPILIVAGVLAVDLYINVQKQKWDYLKIDAKRDIRKWIGYKINEGEVKEDKHDTPAINKNNLNSTPSTGESEERTFVNYLSQLINMFRFKKKQQEVDDENIEFGLRALMSEIESLKAEKSRLENLQNMTRLGYQLGLFTPSPEQIVRIPYSKQERERLVQYASSDMLFPEKPKKTEMIFVANEEIKENKSVLDKIYDYIDQSVSSIRQKILKEGLKSSPAIAEPKKIDGNPVKGEVVEKTTEEKKNDKSVNNIDFSTEFLLEEM